ncbi:hypothetical protein GW17_00031931 [Ensete ventricosum]|nr:hypothetical protein GW17_00031931 [Ensete ventricosum]
MTVVAVEEVVAPVVAFLGSTPHQVGGFEESFLSDLEEDLSPGGVEWSVGEPGDDLLGSFRPLRWEPGDEVGLELPRELVERVDRDEWQTIVPPSSNPAQNRREGSAHYGIQRVVQGYMCSECDNMLNWVGASIICFQHREPKVLCDELILDLGDKGRAAWGALSMLVLCLNDFLNVIYSLVSGESKERVSVSGTLRAEALGVDVGRLTTSPIGVWLGSVWSRRGSSRGCIAKG